MIQPARCQGSDNSIGSGPTCLRMLDSSYGGSIRVQDLGDESHFLWKKNLVYKLKP
jgi:hypothetical protein